MPQDVTGSPGEKIVELCLTDYEAFSEPLFRPSFLGDKWPAIDFYVELIGVSGSRPYLFVQCKATAAPIIGKAASSRISSKSVDIARRLQIPGPTYIFGVHEPSRRVFARSVHTGVAPRAISQISFTHELTSVNLRKLYNEVWDYWQTCGRKRTSSLFT